MKRASAIAWAVLFLGAAVAAGIAVDSSATDSENAAISAPQQSAGEAQATRQAAVYGLGLLGVLGAVVIVELSRPGPLDEENAIADGTHFRCPDCDELVRTAATVCPHCGMKLEAWSGPPGSEPPP